MSQPNLFAPNLERGLERRDQALARLEERYAGLLMSLREDARKVVRRVGRVTSDDLRILSKIKDLGDADPHVWGGIFKELDEQGQPVWRSIGRTPSTLVGNNGRLISMWVLRGLRC